MTSLFLNHPLFFSGTLFVLLIIAVESGFRIAVLSTANLDQDRREQIAAWEFSSVLWLRATPKILAGGCRHPTDDRHRHGD